MDMRYEVRWEGEFCRPFEVPGSSNVCLSLEFPSARIEHGTETKKYRGAVRADNLSDARSYRASLVEKRVAYGWDQIYTDTVHIFKITEDQIE